MSGSVGNLGIISARFGDLLEAEDMYKRGIVLAEQINDPVYISFWHGYLASVLQSLNKLDEASSSLSLSLKAGRAIHFAPCIGIALVALGKLRIAQALLAQENDTGSAERENRLSFRRLLHKADNSLRHALALEGLEAETRIESLQARAYVAFLLGKIELAHQQTLQVLEEARRYDQTWLLACAQRLLGNILSAQGKHLEAATHFSQSLQILKERGMRLEWARTLRDYNESILRNAHSNDSDCERAIAHLQEARQVFEECGAALDLKLTDRLLATYATPARR